jgi:DNA-binding transcriptional MerR regulator
MGGYSIKDLENFTQIKAHTLRIWEQRYNLLTPDRSDTNIRLYSDKELKRILNINLLYNNGLKISKIAQLNDEEILSLASKILAVPADCNATKSEQIIKKILEFDEAGVRERLDDYLQEMPMADVFMNVIIPVLKKIGELWQVDSINTAHEHFFSNILRSFLINHTSQEPPLEAKGTALLFLREGEYHEIGLLFYNYYLRSKGYNTIYLGQSLPVDDLRKIVIQLKPRYIFTSLVAKMDEDEFELFFKYLDSFFDLNNLYVGGYQLGVHGDLKPESVKAIHSVHHIGLE